MTDLVLELGLGLAAGVGLGAVFFGGLLVTVRALTQVAHPGALAAASLLARLAVIAGGMVLVARQGLPALVAMSAAMLLVRFALVRRFGPPAPATADR